LSQISTMTDLREACSGKSLVIEAAPEDMALKKNIFTNIELATSKDTLIATNTSSLSITEISESLSHPSRFIGLHFFNPVPLMPLLEVVLGKETSDFAREQALEISKVIGKEPILVNDVPGFASSRLGVCIGLEAMRMFGEGVASAEDIDKAMELGYRHPMGPLKLTDLVGLDVRLGIAEYLAEQLGPRFEPPQILKDMVAQGKLGKKSGEGFYQW
jgi:3-hydroxybutyryl-CoA dehydrogenase